MLSANEIPGFLNQLFLQNKVMIQPHFFHVDTNSQKLKANWKFFGWACSKIDVANLVSGIWNWLYLKSEEMELTNFLHAGLVQI